MDLHEELERRRKDTRFIVGGLIGLLLVGTLYPRKLDATYSPRFSAEEFGVVVTCGDRDVAEVDARMARVGEPAPDFASAIWVLTHPELRGSARVMAFTRFVRALVARDRDLFEGRRPQPD